MDIITLVDQMSEEMYLRLKCAAETGRWPEGTVVSDEQKTSALQISMAYQSRRLNSDDILSVGPDGNLVNKTKSELRREFSTATPQETNTSNEQDIARFTKL